MVKFIKLIFRKSRKSDIVCVGISSLLIVKMNNLAIFSGSNSYVIMRFECVFFMVAIIFI